MKFLIEYKIRTVGLTHEQVMANQSTLLAAFGKWAPEDGLKVHAFVHKVSGEGGYILLEADDLKTVNLFSSKFIYWNDNVVTPVVDVGDAVVNAHTGSAWAQQALKG